MRPHLRLGNSKGFTLIEVLIVIIIIGVLAGLAIPLYRVTVEKSRKAEALGVLSAMRQAEGRYLSTWNTYTTGGAGAVGSATGPIDFDFSAATLEVGGQTLHFSYAVTTATTNTVLLLTATRNATDGGTAGDTVTLNQAGVVGGTGAFVG